MLDSLLEHLKSYIRENVHQVGSILFKINFIITQLALFYLLLSTIIGSLLQELNVQWSLLARSHLYIWIRKTEPTMNRDEGATD